MLIEKNRLSFFVLKFLKSCFYFKAKPIVLFNFFLLLNMLKIFVQLGYKRFIMKKHNLKKLGL
jgi:hypothetical protein